MNHSILSVCKDVQTFGKDKQLKLIRYLVNKIEKTKLL